MCVRCLVTLGGLALCFTLGAEQVAFYPDAWALIHEAEIASAHTVMFDDRSRPSDWEGHLYARAGYLEDAARAFGTHPAYPTVLLKAQALYGDLPSAEKGLEAITDPRVRTNSLLAVADVLWRMGQPDQARRLLANAKKSALLVPSPSTRQALLVSIDQVDRFVGEAPPNFLSTKPNPLIPRHEDSSSLPSFPITPEGFSSLSPSEMEVRAEQNATLMNELYGRIAARDQAGLAKILDRPLTPFRKALALASIEHLLIQSAQPQTAEDYARQIPETDVDCRLAKAEALSAAGAAWFKAGESAKGNADFELARQFVTDSKASLAARVRAMISIANLQGRAG